MFNREEDIISYIQKAVPYYTPEWVFDPEHPDMGGSFALTFAHMLAETGRLYDKVWDKQYAAFLNVVGLAPLQEQEAEGIVVFELAKGAPEGSLLTAGSLLYDESGEIAYTLRQSLYVSPVELSAVVCTWGEKDMAYTAYERSGDDADVLPFYLFDYTHGENEEEHILYIGHEIAFFIQSGGQIEVEWVDDPAGKAELLADAEIATWEYFTGEWKPFTSTVFFENTLRLTVAKDKAFALCETNAHPGYYIRCRPGSLDQAAKIITKPVKLCVTGQKIPVSKLFHGDIALEDKVFYPFGKSLIPFDVFYLACEEVLCKKGAKTALTVEVSCHSFDSVNLLPDTPVEWNAVMDKRRFAEPKRQEIQITEVALDYWNGKDFVRLKTIEDIGILCRAEDVPEKKTIRFTCPEDMEEGTFNGHTGLWIRIRILEVSNPLAGMGIYIVPYWKNPVFSYRYEDKDLAAGYATIKNNGETRLMARRTGAVQLFSPFEVREPASFFGFAAPPEAGPFGILFEMEFPSDKIRPELTFFCYTESGWQPLSAKDETDNLQHTGLVTFYPEKSWQKHAILGKSLYWVMAACSQKNQRAVYPAFVREVRCNAVKVTSPGKRGNVAKNTVTKMPVSVGYISKVFNPFPISGGREPEDQYRMKKRGSAVLRHRRRAVTAFDFEALAFEGAADLIKCKCFENIDANGLPEKGAVTLVILPGNDEEPEQFKGQEADKVRRYIQERCNPSLVTTGKLAVREAVHVNICISLKVRLNVTSGLAGAEEQVAEKLALFLHPVHGNFLGEGFAIGEIPAEDDLAHFLSSLSVIQNVEAVHIDGFIKKEGRPEAIDLESFPGRLFTVIQSGKHTIRCSI